MVVLYCHSTGIGGRGTLRSATGQTDQEWEKRKNDDVLAACFLGSFRERERRIGEILLFGAYNTCITSV